MPTSHRGFMARNLGAFMGFLALLVVAILIYGLPSAGYAQALTNPQRQDNSRVVGQTALVSQSYTNATTTPTQLTGASVAFTTINDPAETAYPGSTTLIVEKLRVWWSADVSKATGTTGSCQVYLNGNAIARSLRVAGSTARMTIGGYVELSSPTDTFNTGSIGELQTVALYCFSADGSTFSVFGHSLMVQEIY